MRHTSETDTEVGGRGAIKADLFSNIVIALTLLYQVVSVYLQHECYRSGTCGDIPYNDYDIAVLELSQSADVTSSYTANTACLPKTFSTDDFVNNANCWATGFGDTRGSSKLTFSLAC